MDPCVESVRDWDRRRVKTGNNLGEEENDKAEVC